MFSVCPYVACYSSYTPLTFYLVMIFLCALQRLHQELIARKSEIERLNAAACEGLDSVDAASRSAKISESGTTKTRSFTPPGSGPRSKTPPITSSARSRTPPGTVARSKTPPVTATTVRVLPSVRSQTPPVSTSQSRTAAAATVASQQRRSITPPGSGNKSAKSRVPSGSPKRRQLPAVSSVRGSGQEPVARRGSTALWERYRLLLELSSSTKKQLTDALGRQQEVSSVSSWLSHYRVISICYRTLQLQLRGDFKI